jgi:hypothetical protein
MRQILIVSESISVISQLKGFYLARREAEDFPDVTASE